MSAARPHIVGVKLSSDEKAALDRLVRARGCASPAELIRSWIADADGSVLQPVVESATRLADLLEGEPAPAVRALRAGPDILRAVRTLRAALGTGGAAADPAAAVGVSAARTIEGAAAWLADLLEQQPVDAMRALRAGASVARAVADLRALLLGEAPAPPAPGASVQGAIDALVVAGDLRALEDAGDYLSDALAVARRRTGTPQPSKPTPASTALLPSEREEIAEQVIDYLGDGPAVEDEIASAVDVHVSRPVLEVEPGAVAFVLAELTAAGKVARDPDGAWRKVESPRAESVPCPKCKAVTGEPCRSRGAKPHPARVRTASTAAREPALPQRGPDGEHPCRSSSRRSSAVTTA